MNISLSVLLIVCFNICGFGQVYPIELIIDGNPIQGVIFTKEYDGFVNQTLEYVDVNHDEIREAEMFFLKEMSTREDMNRREMRIFRNAKRQYYCHINEAGRKEIHVTFLMVTWINRCNQFQGWREEIILGMGPYFERNVRHKTYVLDN